MTRLSQPELVFGRSFKNTIPFIPSVSTMLARTLAFRHYANASVPLVMQNGVGNARNMATLREIELRLKSVKNIAKITKSMKMIASTKLTKAQRAMNAARAYGAANGEIFEHAEVPTAQGSEPLRKLFVVVSSDKGLCGGIHSSVSKGTRRILATGTVSADGPDAKSQNASEKPVAIPAADSPIVVIGDKSKSQLSRTIPQNLVLSLNQIGKDVPTFADAAVVTDLIVKSGVKYDSVLIVYNKYVSAVAFEAGTMEVLNEQGLREAPGFKRYEQEDDTTRDLAEFTLANAIYAALTEAHCAEQNSRRNAMDNASKNAGDMIDTLTMQYNRGRQAAITNELVDIITGASAL